MESENFDQAAVRNFEPNRTRVARDDAFACRSDCIGAAGTNIRPEQLRQMPFD